MLYEFMGGTNSPLRNPLPLINEDIQPVKFIRLNGEITVGYRRPFEHGAIYWNERSGAHPIYGDIGELYNKLRRKDECKLGFPLTWQIPTGESIKSTKGLYQRFEDILGCPIDFVQEGSFGATIYMNLTHGTYVTRGAIGILHEREGGVSGVLGFPISSEIETEKSTNGTVGIYQRFEGGNIYWSERFNVPVCLTGKSLALFNDLGGVSGKLGFPKSHVNHIVGYFTTTREEYCFEFGSIFSISDEAVAYSGNYLGHRA